MNILSKSRKEIEDMVSSGMLRPENLKHYDLCMAMASGMTQMKATQEFGYTDERYLRRIKSKKCPDCSK